MISTQLKRMLPAYILLVSFLFANADKISKFQVSNGTTKIYATESPFGCICGVFLSGQFKKDSKVAPTGNPALTHDLPGTFPCTPSGSRHCTNKCLDTIIKYLPNSPKILCSSIDRDCYKERAYLFIQNCKSEWINTNLSAGREYCCKDGASYKCPIY